jgi:hypothetical protein
MPGMNGVEVARCIGRPAQVVFVAAQGLQLVLGDTNSVTPWQYRHKSSRTFGFQSGCVVVQTAN